MKKMYFFLTLAMLIGLLAGCGDTDTTPSKPSEPSQNTEKLSQNTEKPSQDTEESTQTDILYAVFGAEDVREYPIEYTGAKKNAVEMANALSELIGLDFNITASETDDGLIVDWAADSTLVAGLDNREQKTEFFFFDYDSMCWFMMDSLWRTLTENLDAENIYYTMDGGQELFLEKMSPAKKFPSDIPYMGSEFYEAHADVQGDEENLYARTKGTWRRDGDKDAASIDMDGFGNFIMYYASGSVEASGYLACTDEFGNGELRYACYTSDGDLIVSFYFDSDTSLHLGNDDGAVYKLDMWALYQGYWEYPDGQILEITADEWAVYEDNNFALIASGTVEYREDAAWLMNDDGSSGGGKINFNEERRLTDNERVLTYLGLYVENAPQG